MSCCELTNCRLVSLYNATWSSWPQSPLVKEYGHMMNRFTGKAAASAGKHVYSPTKILHLSNFEETVTIEVRSSLLECELESRGHSCISMRRRN